MSHTIMHTALATRRPEAVAIAMAQYKNTEAQSRALIEALYECTAQEVKHLHAWAEDWLSDARHGALLNRSDDRWQAMHTLYQIGAIAIKAAGTTMRTERYK